MLGLLGLMLLTWISLVLVAETSILITKFDNAVLRWFAGFRTEPLTDVLKAINAVLASEWTIRILRASAILVLLFFKRFRHLFVLLGSIFLVGWITTVVSLTAPRARPLGVDILAPWQGGSHPSRPAAALAVTLIGLIYCLVPPGKPRDRAKIGLRIAIPVFLLTRLYLGVEHPTDIVFGAVLGLTIPLVAFRLFTPNEAFPVTYKRGRTAHLDVEGPRGEAIKHALEDQLGITVLEAKPFGLAGSGGSTPLRLKVEGNPDTYLFAKLYAANHLRADRWYKLGRTLLYGRLEDEGSFSTVRRLVQYEDYLLRVMRDADIQVPRPYGFVEITPESEYLLVTDFVEGAQEITDAEVNEGVMDGALSIVRGLWDAGVAHRDIKPSNVLLRDGNVHLIDVAFGEVRPSPWRQAVDLANMMIVLALRSDPKKVYERALLFFSPAEIAEAFAATHSVTMPSQSRSMMKKERRNLVKEFRALAPRAHAISVQRWTFRRVALMTGVLLAAFLGISMAIGNLPGAGLLPASPPSAASYATLGRRPDCRPVTDSLALLAQSVPSASRVPCLEALPLGWSFQGAGVTNEGAEFFLESDRAEGRQVQMIFSETCDTSGASQVPSDEPFAERFERVRIDDVHYSGSRYYVFEGGCAEYRFDFRGEGRTALATEISGAMTFVGRDELSAIAQEEIGMGI